jgi:cell division protein FtsI/penicillin-binding protein 2
MGLDETRVSPLQAAAIALTVARDGQLPPLRLVKRRLNVVGEPIEAASAVPAPVRAFSERTARALAAAMRSVVTDPDGTGRGADGLSVSVAMKTGTTGGDGAPLSAAFVGFLPERQPELAFALFTRDSGRSLDVSRRVLGPFLEDLWSQSARGARTN